MICIIDYMRVRFASEIFQNSLFFYFVDSLGCLPIILERLRLFLFFWMWFRYFDSWIKVYFVESVIDIYLADFLNWLSLYRVLDLIFMSPFSLFLIFDLPLLHFILRVIPHFIASHAKFIISILEILLSSRYLYDFSYISFNIELLLSQLFFSLAWLT